jgi:hypothetical protein
LPPLATESSVPWAKAALAANDMPAQSAAESKGNLMKNPSFVSRRVIIAIP